MLMRQSLLFPPHLLKTKSSAHQSLPATGLCPFFQMSIRKCLPQSFGRQAKAFALLWFSKRIYIKNINYYLIHIISTLCNGPVVTKTEAIMSPLFHFLVLGGGIGKVPRHLKKHFENGYSLL